jgi:uncharacterized protein
MTDFINNNKPYKFSHTLNYMLKKDEISKLQKVAEKFKLNLLVIFGSYAKKTQTKNSDIDFAYLDLKEKTNFLDLNYEISKIFDFKKKIDLINLSEDNPPFLQEMIFRNGVLIFENKKGLFLEYRANAFLDYCDFAEIEKQNKKIIDLKFNQIDTTKYKKEISI